ncbi:uncharacterized protein RMCT_3222 [Mycolicibacterium thermoresistibile]|uniref:Uncharacterized protein n=1 Tax=Mycolicibacterium thermoresistibile TaxID=1797 RepID=A0A117IN42_MYCTH|nr:uncharacterized protein RMCT_3222 [Mycolicibacterium thermoresistibile]
MHGVDQRTIERDLGGARRQRARRTLGSRRRRTGGQRCCDTQGDREDRAVRHHTSIRLRPELAKYLPNSTLTWDTVSVDPNSDYDASDELEYGINWFAWILRGVYPPPAYPPV